jgi:hypothetical protein
MVFMSILRQALAAAVPVAIVMAGACAQNGSQRPAASPPAAASSAQNGNPYAQPAKSDVPASPAGKSKGADSAAKPADPAAAPRGITYPVPPDGKWLKDDKGNAYFVDKTEKHEGRYLRLKDNMVRTQWGIAIEVIREDDKFFYYKVYKVDPSLRSVGPDAPPTAKDLEQVAATYKVSVPASHRLSFRHFDNGLPKSGQWREGFDVADMNEDGQLDIVHGTPRKGITEPVIFLGDGKGNWRRWNEVEYPRFPFDYGDLRVADLNGDGHQDIVMAIHLRGLVALLGDGKGHFTLWNKGLDFSVAGHGRGDEGYSSRALQIVDWNGDGKPDIIALGEGPRLNVATPGSAGAVTNIRSYGPVVYLNQGDGSWQRKDAGNGPGQLFGGEITVGDFNGDGRPDFATASAAQGARNIVNLQRADGSWENVEIDVRPGAYVRSVHAVDLDRDGRADLVVGYISYELGVWRQGIDLFYSRPGDKWERRALAVQEGKDGVTALATGDLDGDGNLDLVALTGDGHYWVFLGDGKGFFTREPDGVIPAYEGGCTGYHLKLVDLDHDGKDEIVAAFAGEPSPMYAPDVCRSQGGIQVWHTQPAAAGGRK